MSADITKLASSLERIIQPDPSAPNLKPPAERASASLLPASIPNFSMLWSPRPNLLVEGAEYRTGRHRHHFSLSFRRIALLGDEPFGSSRHSDSFASSFAFLARRTCQPGAAYVAALAHPQWNMHPPRFDVAYAFMQCIEGLDLVRAQLLAEIVYRPRELKLSTFEEITPEVQERITFVIGDHYTTLRDWLLAYREGRNCRSIIS